MQLKYNYSTRKAKQSLRKQMVTFFVDSFGRMNYSELERFIKVIEYNTDMESMTWMR